MPTKNVKKAPGQPKQSLIPLWYERYLSGFTGKDAGYLKNQLSPDTYYNASEGRLVPVQDQVDFEKAVSTWNRACQTSGYPLLKPYPKMKHRLVYWISLVYNRTRTHWRTMDFIKPDTQAPGVCSSISQLATKRSFVQTVLGALREHLAQKAIENKKNTVADLLRALAGRHAKLNQALKADDFLLTHLLINPQQTHRLLNDPAVLDRLCGQESPLGVFFTTPKLKNIFADFKIILQRATQSWESSTSRVYWGLKTGQEVFLQSDMQAFAHNVGFNLEIYNVPMEDFGVDFDGKQAASIIAYSVSQRLKGAHVQSNCKAGRGRGPMLGLLHDVAYTLVRRYQLGNKDAKAISFEKLRQLVDARYNAIKKDRPQVVQGEHRRYVALQFFVEHYQQVIGDNVGQDFSGVQQALQEKLASYDQEKHRMELHRKKRHAFDRINILLGAVAGFGGLLMLATIMMALLITAFPPLALLAGLTVGFIVMIFPIQALIERRGKSVEQYATTILPATPYQPKKGKPPAQAEVPTNKAKQAVPLRLSSAHGVKKHGKCVKTK